MSTDPVRKAFHKLHPETRARRAHEFLIWRIADAVDWDCTYRDIADETGLHIDTVSRICRAKGWSERITDGDASHHGRPDLYSLMNSSSVGFRGRA